MPMIKSNAWKHQVRQPLLHRESIIEAYKKKKHPSQHGDNNETINYTKTLFVVNFVIMSKNGCQWVSLVQDIQQFNWIIKPNFNNFWPFCLWIKLPKDMVNSLEKKKKMIRSIHNGNWNPMKQCFLATLHNPSLIIHSTLSSIIHSTKICTMVMDVCWLPGVWVVKPGVVS